MHFYFHFIRAQLTSALRDFNFLKSFRLASRSPHGEPARGLKKPGV
jgi:hypothetical protein